MIAELLPEEKRKLHELEQQLLELERGSDVVQPSDLYIGLKEIAYRLEELEKLVLKEPKARRDDFRRRVQHLKTTHAHISSSLEALVRRKKRDSYDIQRAELLGEADLEGGNSSIELQLAESNSLARSSQMMNEYIATGQETLANLLSQRERLKGIQRKALDILNYLGAANSIMKFVERRDFIDKLLVFGGMLFILVLIAFVWFYLKK